MTEQILGAMVISLVSGIIGNVIGSKGTIKQAMCDERRIACNKLVIEKIENLTDRVEALTKVVDSKLLGI